MFLVGVSGNDPKNDFEIFLKNYAWILCIVVVVIALAVFLILFLRGRKNKGNKKTVSQASPSSWIEALGGEENISDISSTGSRLSVKIVDKEKINREALTSLGVTSIVMMSDKVTLVTNLDNQKIVENMKNSLQK